MIILGVGCMSIDNREWDEILAVYEEDELVDVTGDVTCYDRGKTVNCECGHGIGVQFSTKIIRCHACGAVLVDRQHDEREAPDRGKSQSSLSKWT